MSSTLEKEWAAVEGEKIVVKSNTRENLSEELNKRGLSESDYEIVALPMSHKSLFV